MGNKNLKIEDIGEFAFIRSIMDNCQFSSEKMIRGIGDDCAVIGPYENRVLLITTDVLVEDVHFIMGKILPEHLGQKAVAVNLSDIAAMGGKALCLFLSLAIPNTMSVETLKSIYRGIKNMCKRYRINLMGGDTSASPGGLMISVTAIGDANKREVLYRDSANQGDGIYVTGNLGDSGAGLKLIKNSFSAPEPIASRLIEAHNIPVPYLEAGSMIARSGLASAMIDLSDGLVPDLHHICESSHTGARLNHDALPISKELSALAQINNFDPYELALSGGEDYKLLITIPEKNIDSFEKMFQDSTPCPVYRVGEITKGKNLTILSHDGVEEQLDVRGFDHFLPI